MSDNNHVTIFDVPKRQFWISAVLFSAALLGMVLLAMIQSALAPSLLVTITLNLFLSVVSIGATGIGAYIISREQLRSEVREQDENRIREVTAIAATELNNFYQAVVQLDSTWNEIADGYRIHPSIQRSLNDTLEHMMSVIQSSINTIIGLSRATENPFKLVNYATKVHCPVYRCDNLIEAQELSAYPRATWHTFCTKCQTVVRLRRRHDGSILASIARTADAGPATMPVKRRSLREVSIRCPNTSCRAPLTIAVNDFFATSSRACPECQTVFTYGNRTGNIEIRAQNFNKVISAADLVNEGFGIQVKCGCGENVGTKYLRPNGKGIEYVICHSCGSIMLDQDRILHQQHLTSKAVGRAFL